MNTITTELFDIRGLKAETLLAISNAPKNLSVKMKGTFSRNFSEDLIKMENTEDGTVLTVARDGIFHIMPQGLFFDENLLAGKTKSNFEFEKIHRELRRKKKEVSTFFLPFDTELFKLTFEYEKILNNLANAGNEILVNAFLDNLSTFNSQPQISNLYISKLKPLIPFANQMRGNIPFLTDILKLITASKKIEVKKITSFHTRFIIHKENLSKEEYHAMEKDMCQLFDFLRHWFLPIEKKFDYRLKDYTQPFKLGTSAILDYNTHFKYGKTS